MDSLAAELSALDRLAPVVAAAREAGQVYLVGGAVRDLLLGKPSFDVDLVVEGDAIAFARRLAEALGGEVVAHDRFGTAVIHYGDGDHLDVVTARSETYESPAALPTVEAGTIEDDLRRRDFTINAIAASLAPADFGHVVDPSGGRTDLAAGTIRVLHERSFVDDPTRIFRAIRYENRFGFRMDETTERLARTAIAAGLAGELSGPRLREELVALLSEERIAHTVARLAELEVLPVAADASSLVERLDFLRAELDPEAPAWKLRLALLVRADPQIVDRLMLRRPDAHSIESSLAALTALSAATDPVEIADLAAGAPDAPLLALTLGESPALRDWFERLRNVRLEVSGTDLAELGLAESPRVGEVLGELRRRKLRGELVGRDEELAAARALIDE